MPASACPHGCQLPDNLAAGASFTCEHGWTFTMLSTDADRDAAAAATSTIDQYAATVRDVARAHGNAFGDFYAALAQHGMYADHAANLTAIYTSLVTNDYLTSKSRA